MKHRSFTQYSMPIQLLFGILGILSILITTFVGYQKGTSFTDTTKLCVLAIVLISIIVFYIQSQNPSLKEIPFFNTIMIVTYSVSLLLIVLTQGKGEIRLSMLGGLLIAMLLDMHLGLIMSYNLIFFTSIAGDLNIEAIVYLLIIETLMCLLSRYLKKLSTVGYVVIIVLSTQIILIFLMNNFIISKSLNLGSVYSILSSLGVMCISYVGYSIYYKKVTLNKMIKKEFEDILDSPREVAPTPIYSGQPQEPIGFHSWNEILNEEFPLIQRLKSYSSIVYNHSLRISDLSGRAAIVIGAEEYKARAGGLYHEIGRIEGTQYVEEGIKLIEDYHLPNVIGDYIKQHNPKYENPKSVEAAIVMLTVSLVATQEYLEKTTSVTKKAESEVSNKKLVDNVFLMRLSKGSLDDSGLTIHQYNTLKDFFLQM